MMPRCLFIFLVCIYFRKDVENVVVPAPARFSLTPDSFLLSLCNIVRVKFEKRESNPVFCFHCDLYKDFPLCDAVIAVASFLQVPKENVRLFAVNQIGQYILNVYITHSNREGMLQSCIQYKPMFVFEVLDHPVDLLKTHVQANINYMDSKFEITLVRPMCPKNGTMLDVVAAAKVMLAGQGILLGEVPLRCVEIINGKVSRVIPLETLGAAVFDWGAGFSSPQVFVRLEAIPEDELALNQGDKLIWLHSVSPSGAPRYNQTHGTPFSAVARAGEKVSDFKLQLAHRLGESADAAKRWKLCTHFYSKYEQLPEDAIVVDQNIFSNVRDTNSLAHLGIQRPSAQQKLRADLNTGGISITEDVSNETN